MDSQENTTYLIKMVEYGKYHFKSKEKLKYVKKKRNQLLCRVQKKKNKTKNKNINGVALKNKIVQQTSICFDCDSKKSTFLKPIK